MKKGFTLIELIAVILIIGVIALIATPIALNMIKTSKQKAYERTILSIEQAASNYSIYNELGYSSSYKSLYLSEMQDKGYLNDSDIIDPRNDSVLEGCVVYRWLNETNQYEFKYKDNCNENLYPDVVINVINDNGNEWMNEKLQFELDNSYSLYKYCIGSNECVPNQDYVTTTTVDEVGQNIYICATGYSEGEARNSSCTKAYKVDDTAPVLTINSISTTSDKIIVNASCNDDISGVESLQYSINNGSYQNTSVFSSLTPGTYEIKIKCKNFSGIEEMASEIRQTTNTPMPTIAQLSQTPSSGDYARERVIRITYNGTGIENPSYYYSLDGNDWISVSGITKDVTFTSDGYLYAKTVDDAGNTATASTYTVANIDTTAPSVSASVSGKTATFTMSDNIGVVAYGVNSSTTVEPTYTSITTTTSTTITWESSQAGDYVVWVKDVSGRVTNASFTHDKSAFSYAATLSSSTYTGTAYCPSGYTQSGTNCSIWRQTGTSCTCNSGDSLSGSTCTHVTTATYESTCYLFKECTKCKCTTFPKDSYNCNQSDFKYDCETRLHNNQYGKATFEKVQESACGSEEARGSRCKGKNSSKCDNGGTLNGDKTACTVTSTSTYGASCVPTGTTETIGASYSCNTGDSLSGSTCTHKYYTCPNGGTLSGTTCVF